MCPLARIHRSAPTALGLSLALLLAACGGDSTAPPSPASVTVSSPMPLLTALGETAQLRAQVLDGRGSPMTGQAINWSSGNAAVIQVSASGLATATGVGTATVTASTGSASGSLSLTVEQRPSELAIAGGVGQESEVGTVLPEPISFLVSDSRGNPVANTTITLSVKGGGSVPAPQITTATDGSAQVVWTLGTRASDTQELVATSGTLSRAVTAGARPGPPSEVVPASGVGQTGLAGEVLPDSLEVIVQDRFGNPVPSAAVAWSVTAGGGSVGPTQGVSSPAGTVRTSWVLGGLVGLHRARATLGGVHAEFQANGLPNGVIQGTVSFASAFLAPEPVAFAGAMSAEGSLGGGGKSVGGAADPLGLRVGSAMEGTSLRGTAAPRVDTVPGQWIVRMRGASPAGALGVAGFSVAAAQAEGTALRDQLSAIRTIAAGTLEVSAVAPVLGVARVEVKPGAEGNEVIRQLREAPEVEWVEPVILYQALGAERTLTTVPAPPAAPPFRAPTTATAIMSERFYPQQSWHYGMIGLPRAWEVSTGSPNVIVAVVDDGIRFDHPSVAGNLTNDGYDFVGHRLVPVCGGGTVPAAGDGDGWDPDPTVPVLFSWNGSCVTGLDPMGGHGLHVAGTIAASAALVGVAPGVRIRPVRVLDSTGGGTSWDVAAGITYAAGLPVEVGPGQVVQVPRAAIINLSLGGPASQAEQEAVASASLAGSLLVAAAGNQGSTTPMYPAAYPQTLSVSALRPDFGIASYSNRGSTIDIAAPGGETTWGLEMGVWSAFWHFGENAPVLWPSQGTSMAAPHVSGVAALVLSHAPGLSAGQLRDILLQTATDLGTPGRDHLYGHGVVNAFAAVTRGQGLPAHLRVHLTRADTGERVASVAAGAGGSFRFPGLSDGDYRVHAGVDDRGDGVTGRPGFSWGALGGSSTPSAISISGHGVRNGSFTIGFPMEREPNGSASSANELEVGGYAYGSISPTGDVDVFRVRIPSSGTYTFETHGWYGLCGWGMEVDTLLELHTEGGQRLAQHDDIDASRDRLCSRISLHLGAGVYFIRVSGLGTGYYAVSARSGGG